MYNANTKSREEKSEVKIEDKYLVRINKKLKFSIAYISTFSCNTKNLQVTVPVLTTTNRNKQAEDQQFPLVNQRIKGQTNIVRLKK